jgi:hypothetical protein
MFVFSQTKRRESRGQRCAWPAGVSVRCDRQARSASDEHQTERGESGLTLLEGSVKVLTRYDHRAKGTFAPRWRTDKPDGPAGEGEQEDGRNAAEIWASMVGERGMAWLVARVARQPGWSQVEAGDTRVPGWARLTDVRVGRKHGDA